MKVAILAGASVIGLMGGAEAGVVPHPCAHDPRIRCQNYTAEPIEIWTAAQGTIMIQLEAGETLGPNPKGLVADPDKNHIGIIPEDNFISIKTGTCLIREPLHIITHTANGRPRLYTFEIHTEPQICPNQQSGPPAPNVNLASARLGDAPAPPQYGNLDKINYKALSEEADVMYTVKFAYPDDDREKRLALIRERHAKAEKKKINNLLSKETDFDTHDPFVGVRNLRYEGKGSEQLKPRWIWDNGYTTAMIYPGLQSFPVVYRLLSTNLPCGPGDKEELADFSVHGDTIIIPGTAQAWCLRVGDQAREEFNHQYNPVGATPGTGTISPAVVRALKSADADDRIAR